VDCVEESPLQLCVDSDVLEHLVENVLHFVCVRLEQVEVLNDALDHLDVQLPCFGVFEGIANLVHLSFVWVLNFPDQILSFAVLN